MIWLFLLACNPWSGVVEREGVWYDADRIETELDLELIEIEAGEPLGYWPRIVVRSDRIEFDNRAWFLSLPEAFFLSKEHTVLERRAHLVESQTVERLEAGSYEPIHGQEVPFPQLSRVFEEHVVIVDSFRQRYAMSSENPYRTTMIAEPDVPWGTAMGILVTAGGTLLDLPVLAARVGNRLRTPTVAAEPDAECMVDAIQRVTSEGAWVRIPGIPPLTGDGGCVGWDWETMMDAVETLMDGCRSRWPSVLPLVGQGPPNESRTYDACVRVSMQAEEDVRIESVMTALAATYRRYPDAYPGHLLADVDSNACNDPLLPSDLTESHLDGLCDALLDHRRASSVQDRFAP